MKSIVAQGLHVVEMQPSRHFLPQKIASPILTPLKQEHELDAIDVRTDYGRLTVADD